MRVLALFILLGGSTIWAEPLLDAGFRQMYNLQFADAHKTFAEYEHHNPTDPIGPIGDAAAYLFSEFDRLKILQAEFWTEDNNFLDFHKPDADPAIRNQFEAALARSRQLSEARMKTSPEDSDSLFASCLRLGLHSDYLALIEKRNIAALSEIKESRLMAERLLARHPEYYDAYIAEGIENYLLSLKPAPVRWILHATGSQTDKQSGIQKLRLTAEKGHYLLPYARLLLAVADLRDHAPARAKARLEWLSREYPQNRLYREELARLQ